MEREAASAAYADLHKDAPYHDGSFKSWAKERSRSHPYHYGDGVTFGVADHDLWPGDRFTTDQYASPSGVVSPDLDPLGDDADAQDD